MKNILYLGLFWVMMSYANAQSAREPQTQNTSLNKHQELASKRLSEGQMVAYTKRAKQKLQDASEYMRLVLNSKDATEQMQALKQLHYLFWNVPDWAKSMQSIALYAGKDKNGFTTIEIKQNLAYNPALREYRGELSYQIASKTELLNFKVIKNKKKIGSQEVEVWELFFNP